MKNIKRYIFFLFLLFLISSDVLYATVRLPKIFSDGMVLQRNQKVLIWGFADNGEKVTLQVANQKKTTNADAKGHWEIILHPFHLGPVLSMSVWGTSNIIIVKDILVGDVFQVSGQSNAAMSMSSSKRYPGTQQDIDTTILPMVRIFQVPWSQFYSTPQEDVPQTCSWESLRPEKNGGFSAMAFYFARDLYKHLGIPIGIVRASHAGGMAEIKMSKEALLSFDEGRKFYESALNRYNAGLKDTTSPKGKNPTGINDKYHVGIEAKPNEKVDGRYPSSDWNGAIAPIIRYTKIGVLWYQGEHNAGLGSFAYRITLPVLIRNWRKASGNHKLPFIIVQLPAHQAEGWPLLRESQLVTFQKTKNAGFVVMIDHGEKENIHPADKKFLGERLALEARRLLYGEAVAGYGPLYDHFAIKKNKITVHFKKFNGSLIASSPHDLPGFIIAGADGKFFPAKAAISGSNVIVWNEEVQNPKAVRYLWESFPVAVGLFGSNGLPASPFRTDSWNDNVN